MLMRLHGWADADVLALLSLFRKYLVHYVYTSDNAFVEVVRAELAEKQVSEILEMVRALMHQFALGLSTKNFRMDVIVANGQEVYVYKHIYESISALQENKVGGMWLPDELRRLLQKARQYRDLSSRNEDVYFKRIQVWSKSVAETKIKFHAFRSIYVREKKQRTYQRKRVESVRLELLETIFGDVSATRRTGAIAASGKTLRLWSSVDMETLVDFVVRITKEIQRTGRSDLVNYVSEAVHRSDASCVHKLVDMKDKFLRKSTAVRAANLPAIVFDPASEAYKIFSANWNNQSDPYALGYLALRRRSHRLTAERSKKRRSHSAWVPPSKLRSATSVAHDSSTSRVNATNPTTLGVSPSVTAKSLSGAQNAASAFSASEPCTKETAAVSRPPPVVIASANNALSTSDSTTFVHDIAEQCRWTDEVVHSVLRCMQQSFELHRSNRLIAFFSAIASQIPGVAFQDVFVHAQFILTRFEQRFGSLDGFENLALDIYLSTSTEHETVGRDHSCDSRIATSGFTQCSTGNCSRDGSTQAPMTADGSKESHVRTERATGLYTFRETVVGEKEHDRELVRHVPAAQRTSHPENENEAVKKGDREHVHERLPCAESPTRTPQTGDEDTADVQSLSTVGKQSSPEGIWDERDDGYSDADNGDLNNLPIDSLDGASSNFDEAKSSHHSAESDSCMSKPYVSPRQHDCDSSSKSSRRGKDEQYGKSSAKKRRLYDKNEAVSDDDGSDHESGVEDESSDDADDGDYTNDDADKFADVSCHYSGGKDHDTSHPLRSILDSLGSQIAGLQDKQRVLIVQKEDREWRQRERDDLALDCAPRHLSARPVGICDEQITLSRYESRVRRHC